MLLDVYGNAKEYAGEKCFIPFRYQGQYEDEDTELYYNRFRYYAPEMGIYISSDPIGLAGNNPTLYGYVSNPTISLDPLGLDPLGTKGYSVYALYEKGASSPYYIGITKQDVETRMEQHIKTGRYGPDTIHKVLQEDITIERARGYEQFYIERYGTKTGIIGAKISKSNRGNKINSFDKTRTDERGLAFKAEYDNIVKEHNKKIKTCN